MRGNSYSVKLPSDRAYQEGFIITSNKVNIIWKSLTKRAKLYLETWNRKANEAVTELHHLRLSMLSFAVCSANWNFIKYSKLDTLVNSVVKVNWVLLTLTELGTSDIEWTGYCSLWWSLILLTLTNFDMDSLKYVNYIYSTFYVLIALVTISWNGSITLCSCVDTFLLLLKAHCSYLLCCCCLASVLTLSHRPTSHSTIVIIYPRLISYLLRYAYHAIKLKGIFQYSPPFPLIFFYSLIIFF